MYFAYRSHMALVSFTFDIPDKENCGLRPVCCLLNSTVYISLCFSKNFSFILSTSQILRFQELSFFSSSFADLTISVTKTYFQETLKFKFFSDMLYLLTRITSLPLLTVSSVATRLLGVPSALETKKLLAFLSSGTLHSRAKSVLRTSSEKRIFPTTEQIHA